MIKLSKTDYNKVTSCIKLAIEYMVKTIKLMDIDKKEGILKDDNFSYTFNFNVELFNEKYSLLQLLGIVTPTSDNLSVIEKTKIRRDNIIIMFAELRQNEKENIKKGFEEYKKNKAENISSNKNNNNENNGGLLVWVSIRKLYLIEVVLILH